MRYEMEELVLIVAKLAEKYTAYESSSVTYEKAEQLMGAVLYCIHEMKQPEYDSLVLKDGISAQQAYEIGAACVVEKVKKALNLYNEIVPEFICYGNACLYNTFVRGLPEFFKWYDSRFMPQDTILTLDYPVLKDISGYMGIDKIYEFIKCISMEQRFLHLFPEDYVVNILSKHNRQYKEMTDNICEIVFLFLIGHTLAEKPLSEPDLGEEDYLHIQEIFMGTDRDDIDKQLKNQVEVVIGKYCEDCDELLEYLSDAVGDIVIRLKNEADEGSLCRVFNGLVVKGKI